MRWGVGRVFLTVCSADFSAYENTGESFISCTISQLLRRISVPFCMHYWLVTWHSKINQVEDVKKNVL